MRLDQMCSVAVLLTSSVGCYVEPPPGALLPPLPTPAEKQSAAAARAVAPAEPALPPYLTWYEEGVRLLENEEYALAINAFDTSLGVAPNFGLSYANRGCAYRNIGDYGKAAADFRKAIELVPSHGYMHRLYLAEILAAAPDVSVRDGKEAVEVATQGCKQTNWEHGVMLAVLAAAYAEQGDFASAVRWQTEAGGHVDESLAEEMAARLELYRGKKPCRRFFSDPRGLSALGQ